MDYQEQIAEIEAEMRARTERLKYVEDNASRTAIIDKLYSLEKMRDDLQAKAMKEFKQRYKERNK